MKHYLLKEKYATKEELHMMGVKPEDETRFLEQYAGQILVSGNSIQEVIIQFSQLLQQEQSGE